MKFKKASIVISLVAILSSSTVLLSFSSKKNFDIINNKIYELQEKKLNDNAIKFKYCKKLDLVLKNYGFKETNKFLSKDSESFLEKKAKKYIKVYDLKLNENNNFAVKRIYLHDSEKIENTIYNFLDEELNDQLDKKNEYEDFAIETAFINKYLNIKTINEDNSFQNKLSNLYLKKLKSANNIEYTYLSNFAYNQYKLDIEKEKKPNYFADSINGWSLISDQVDSFWVFAATLIITLIITTAIMTIISSSVAGAIVIDTLTNLIFRTLIAKGFASITKKIIFAFISFIITGIISFPINRYVRSDIREILKNQKLNFIIEKNSYLLTKKYGEDISKKYKNYFKEGFKNGISGKLNSIFGNISVKDRAALIFDRVQNPLWNLNYVTSNSIANFRKWLPWLTYTEERSKNHYFNNSQKLTFFTSTIATKGTWTGTYYGDIDNPKENSYDLDWSANWLERTNLKLTPKFTKKTSLVAKAMFISENLINTKNYARVYLGNEMEFSNLDYKVKLILKNYPINTKSYDYKFKVFGDIFK